MPFAPDDEVVVAQVDDENWEVRAALHYQGNVDPFTVPVGTRTDFASVPRALIWFLPRYGSYTMAAILHDYLWKVWAAQGRMDWEDADGIFQRALRELDVPFLRRWLMWAAVRWGALLQPRGRIGWLREGWKVVLLSLLALPVVAPPAIVIVVALAVFYVLEFLVWVPLEVSARVRARVARPAYPKEVNRPTMGLRASR